jgi:hypothetical protein
VPEQIKPWIDLLTWQLLALVAGVALLPAIYILLSKIKSANISFGMLEVTSSEAKKINERSEEVAEESTSLQAAQSITDVQNEEDPEGLRDRLENAITLWNGVRVLVKDRAFRLAQGQNDLRPTVSNLERLARVFPNLVLPKDVARGKELESELKEYTGNPKSLTKQAYRSFMNRSGRLARKIEAIQNVPTEAQPPIAH